VLFNQIKLRNILSFNETTVELRGLNVLIGPNGVGKSNLIEVIALLHAAPTDLQSAVLQLGGVRAVISLSTRKSSPIAGIECWIAFSGDLRYALEFSEDAQGFVILNERIAALDGTDRITYFERRSESVRLGPIFEGGAPDSEGARIPRNQSVLYSFKSPADQTPITRVGHEFGQIKIYREFRTCGPSSSARNGVSTSVMKTFCTMAETISLLSSRISTSRESTPRSSHTFGNSAIASRTSSFGSTVLSQKPTCRRAAS